MLIEAPELSSFPNVRHCFFTRRGGVSEGIYASLNGGLGSRDDPDRVVKNRALMADQIGTEPANLVSLHQIHSATVVTATEPWTADNRPRADGVVTRVPHIALGILTADCGPILFADHGAGVIGACHAGWGGALGGVIEATVDAMVGLGAAREDIVAVLGPTIGPDAYEVGPEFLERFVAADEAYGRFFRPAERAGHSMFDLPAFILDRLEATRIGEAANLGLCTYSDEENYFSYRRTTHRGEPDYGRQVSAIMLTR